MIPLIFVILVIVATIWLGIVATKKSKTAADFFVAGRSVSVFWNASAISGEYLSAASFMGVAGLIMKNGYDALWYPVGYATGYLFLLLFIAGPLRRFGAYTIPDFAQGRFDSPTFRKVAVIFVLCIGFFYTMPQMKGAGVVMNSILGWPYWVGIAIVGSVITFNVAMGGMKGITIVQAFQYWVKVFAISAPLFVLINVFGGYGSAVAKSADAPKDTPRIKNESVVKVKGAAGAPNNVLALSIEPLKISFPEGATLSKIGTARKPEIGEDVVKPEDLLRDDKWDFTGGSFSRDSNGNFHIDVGQTLLADRLAVTKGGAPVLKDGAPVMTSAKLEFAEPTSVRIESVAPRVEPIAPNAPSNSKWVNPFGPMSSKHGYPLLYTYSLIIALVCGTAGLPHILVRFYTNPDGRAARRTTLWVMVMLGAFYFFTPIWGALGRAVMPQLYASNATDTVVIKLPTMLQNETLGLILSGITSAGAFAAFMSTFSGLLVSMSGAFAHDIYGRILKPTASPADRMRAFKIAAIGVGAVSMLLGLFVESFDIAMMVGWAFAIGAASYFPLLLLGSWWRGLTKYGAAAGMLIGGLLSLTAIVCSMLLDKSVVKWQVSPLTRSLMEQPAIWGVPLSIALMVIVSKM
ncbi:MAG TPA: cation acetate symporter, partial [Fimbriimonas sp.]|nr:cation acetate symporter [Fimbriimonas sp.]